MPPPIQVISCHHCHGWHTQPRRSIVSISKSLGPKRHRRVASTHGRPEHAIKAVPPASQAQLPVHMDTRPLLFTPSAAPRVRPSWVRRMLPPTHWCPQTAVTVTGSAARDPMFTHNSVLQQLLDLQLFVTPTMLRQLTYPTVMLHTWLTQQHNTQQPGNQPRAAKQQVMSRDNHQ